MKIKVSEATGLALDYLVAKAEGFWFGDAGHCNYALYQLHKYGPAMPASMWKPSSDWSQGGPIIEREKIGVWWDGAWHAKYDGCRPDQVQDAHQPLIAAMRCYVTSKLGDEVEIPEELA